MNYKKYKLTGKFLVSTSTYMGYNDGAIYNKETTGFDNDEFDMITALITICLDMDSKSRNINELVDDYLTKTNKSLSPYCYCKKGIELYFKNDFDINISKTDAENILDKIEEFMSEYHNCESITCIDIVKDNELLKILEQKYDDVKQAVEFITNNLDKLDNE
jgi:hypothetical protein